jgi:hypothetical protein
MSLLDKASLIVTPNSYKESKLYSVVPSSGAGDMDVVRATTATRVNSAGLIEVVPRNLLRYSDTLNDFSVLNATKTNNVTTSPFGLNNASSLMETATTVFDHYVTNGGFGSYNNSLTYSVYLKQNGRRYVQLATVSGQGVARPIFDLQDGVYVNNVGSNTGITTAIENVGNGWFRCSVIHPSNTTNLDQVTVILQKTATYESYLGDITKGVFVFGAQLEQGSTATEYFPTTTRLNIPRIDYTNGSCPSLLVEPQRTNLLIYSNNFTSTYWADDGTTTRTANSGISPDGTQNAIKITSNGGYNYRILPALSAGTYTYSIYVKASAAVNINIVINDIGGSGGTTKNIAVTTNWQRFDITKNITLGTFVVIDYSALQSGFDFYFYGAQVELGSYATSYVPTVATAVTRNADVISKTGISSLIGQTEGTLFLDVNLKVGLNSGFIAQLSDGTQNNRVQIGLDNISNNTIYYQMNGNGNLGMNGQTNFTDNQRLKIAISYKSGDSVFYLNGVKINSTSENSVNTPISLDRINFGASHSITSSIFSRYNSSIIFKTRLTNSELASLTTI